MSSPDEDPLLNGTSDGGDDDDVIPSARRSNPATNGANGNHQNSNEDDDDADADLFGSDNGDDDEDKPRLLDDEDLDSGDDSGRRDRANRDADHDMDDIVEEKAINSMTVDVGRQPVPEPTDGELYLLKVPKFLSLEPVPFDPETFIAPTADHHLDEPSAAFNAHSTAMTTLRWRKSPSNPSEMQSNARILRWADGSLTLQIASEPHKQYTLPGKPLAPPQIDPPKPTPVSLKRKATAPVPPYDPNKDSFTYLLTPSASSELLRVTNKITAGLQVQPTKDAKDDAIIALQVAMRKAAQANGETVQTRVTEDPELAKKRAELAEKEIARVERRRLNAAARGEGRNERFFGRRSGGGGLTIGGLEEEDDELGMGYTGGRTAASGRKPKQRRKNNRGEIYSDDEEEGDVRGRTREDEYDEEDDFVAGSDEEEEVGDDDDDLDEGISLDQVKRRQASPATKRKTPEPSALADQDAEGDPDSDASPAPGGEGSPVSRSKRRRVIDDDDDEDE